jgi:peptidoglycan/LPS O-acetylase OafA/YrhL
LLFRLFQNEGRATGGIDVARFYARRLLRIYPLMMLAPVLLMFLTDQFTAPAFGQLFALAFFVDNFLAWVYGYNTAIPLTAHLWTLSFEFQIYLMLPAAFLLFALKGTRTFLISLGIVLCVALGARVAFVLSNVGHPVIWVTPFFRPESVLAGLALAAISMPVWSAVGAIVVFAASLTLLSLIPNVTDIGLWTPAIYILCGLFSGSLLTLSLTAKPIAAVLSWRPIRFLGKISFGLYVFHFPLVTIVPGLLIQNGYSRLVDGRYWTLFGIILLSTVFVATLSYYLVERPFLKLKAKLR